jgi:hypothetical protein
MKMLDRVSGGIRAIGVKVLYLDLRDWVFSSESRI